MARLVPASIKPVGLETGAIFLAGPTATALDVKDVHVRSTIAAAHMSLQRNAIQTLGLD